MFGEGIIGYSFRFSEYGHTFWAFVQLLKDQLKWKYIFFGFCVILKDKLKCNFFTNNKFPYMGEWAGNELVTIETIPIVWRTTTNTTRD